MPGILFISVFSFEIFASTHVNKINRPGKAEGIIAKVVVELISKKHFSHKKLNDDISEQLFTTYFTSLDPQKLYFVQSDLDQYSDYKFILDNSLAHGQVEFAYKVFDTFVQRVDERVQFVGKLLNSAFDFSREDELLIERKKAQWCVDTKELDSLWTLRLKNDLLNRVLKIHDSKEESKGSKIERVRRIIESKDYKGVTIKELSPEITYEKMFSPHRNYLSRLRNRESIDILEKFLTTLSKLYDPYSAYMAPKTKEDFDISMKLSLEGIGARLKEVNGEIVVNNIMVGGAAYRDGRLKERDRVIAVSQDGIEFTGVESMSLRNVIGMIRGPVGSHVFLKVTAKGDDENNVRTIEIIRDIIDLKDREATLFKKHVVPEDDDVFSNTEMNVNLLDGQGIDIGIIMLPSFYTDFDNRDLGVGEFRSASQDVLNLLKDADADAVSGVIVDLRSNRGGSLDEAVRLAGLFINKGPVVQVKYANGRKKILADKDDKSYYDGPLIVLVDRYSASASEIFSAAIQDYNRGIIIGDKSTHGKGTIQMLHELDDRLRNRMIFKNKSTGTLKLTTGKFYRVNGSSTQHDGVRPDIIFPSVRDYHTAGERFLDHALPWDKIESLTIDKFHNYSKIQNYLVDTMKLKIAEGLKFNEIVNAVNEYDNFKKNKIVPLNYLKRKYYEKRKKTLLNNVKRYKEKQRTRNQLSKNDWLLNEAMNCLAILVKLHEKDLHSLSYQDIDRQNN